jgi:hypothetical protein
MSIGGRKLVATKISIIPITPSVGNKPGPSSSFPAAMDNFVLMGAI